MDKTRAVRLLDDTFRTNFDLNQFSLFIKELFNKISINIQDKTPYIAKQFNEYIAEFKKIAEYKDASKKSMEVLAVKLKRTASRDRARTMQRNFVSSWLSKQGIDAALVAFYGDDNEDWRFSYVKMEYSLVKNENEKVIIEKELTPARRYSFLVGVNEPNHTCQRQFLELIMEEKTNPSISEIEQAFSIEKVTKEFFEEYKELAINLKESMDKILSKDSRIKTEFDNKGISTIEFSKKLLGQIVFLYFLQKKGWLGVQKQPDGTFGEWGTGPKKFLRQLFDKNSVSHDNFFNDMLEPLFYEALATDRSADNDYYSRFKCKIPFLNGGLFEPLNDYDWTGVDIKIPNDLFSNSIKTRAGDVGTGILDVFDRYNFTVKEDEPLEKEVAVDPETLGKIFENLLDVKDRKDKGAFYTPREIVHYMCQQSLINYLETNTSGVPREDIERFIQYGDIALDQTVRSLSQKESYHGKSYVDEKLLVPKSIADDYRRIDKLLQDIKIVDPAVGSGAFPVGMMNEIVKARSILTLFFPTEEQKERTEYNLKRQCIENCLYGVDIDPSAVEIAKLRFWLSLIVDEEKKEDIQPLPNLDHKIMCGNSLLEEFEGIKLFDERLLGEIAVKTPTEVEIDSINEQILKLNDGLKDIRFGYQRPEIKQKIEQRETLKKRKETLEKRLEKEKRQKDKGAQITIDQALEHRIKESQIKLSKLKTLQKEFFNEQNRNKKKKLREEIDKIEWDLIRVTLEEQGNEEALKKLEQYKKNQAKPFFLWKLYFAEVFQRDNPGFDVVIANPPYVDSENMVRETPELRVIYTRIFNTAKGNWDLFIIFIEHGLNLLRPHGCISYIVPNKLIGAKYSESLKQTLLNYRIIEIRDYSSVDVFKEVDVYPVTFNISKNNPNNQVNMTLMESLEIENNRNTIPPDIFYQDTDWARYFEKDKEALKIVMKITQNNPLVTICPNIFGAATVNEAYNLKNYLIDNDGLNNCKRFINTGTIDPYTSLWGKKVTRYIKQGYRYPVVKDTDLKSFSRTRYNQACSEKVILGGMTLQLEAFYDRGEYLAGKSTTIILPGQMDLKVITALLNSKLISFWYRIFFKSLSLAGGYLRISSNEIKRVPVCEIPNDVQKRIIKIVDSIIDAPDNVHRNRILFEDIDKIIYSLYKITPEEVQIIERYNIPKSETNKDDEND